MQLGPYIWKGIDCGALMDHALEDARKAMAKSRDDAVRWLVQMRKAHADWYRDSRPSKRELQKLSTPFSAAIRELENWLEANPPPPKPPRPKKGVVYFIGMESDNTAVKIGFATKIENRLSSLQTSSHHTLKVLATIKATARLEKDMHRKFAADHIRGEWFCRTEAIEKFMAANAGSSGTQELPNIDDAGTNDRPSEWPQNNCEPARAKERGPRNPKKVEVGAALVRPHASLHMVRHDNRIDENPKRNRTK